MSPKQEEIIINIGKKYGISKSQALEIWELGMKKIKLTITDPEKKKDGFYDPEKFKTIYITGFGKFIPDKRKIRHANMCLKTNEENKKNKK